jgi:hypothetical protein
VVVCAGEGRMVGFDVWGRLLSAAAARQDVFVWQTISCIVG